MSRAAGDIQAEITTLEAYLQSPDSLVASASSRGTSLVRPDRAKIREEIKQLYVELGRANGASPMFARAFVDGLR